MKLKAVAVDDSLIYLTALEQLCARFDFIELTQKFTDPVAALGYVEQYPPDLIFLDISMPPMSGLEFCKTMKAQPIVIMTTAFEEYALASFELDVLDYLLKPYTASRFEQALEKARKAYAFKHNPEIKKKERLILKSDYGIVQIAIDDIVFIEGLNNYMMIYLVDGTRTITRITRRALMERLPKPDFLQVHRSYIVAFSKIISVNQKTIFFGRWQVPIGTNFVTAFFSRYK
jgi:DNA-binding LytR/AlgR family response regulator